MKYAGILLCIVTTSLSGITAIRRAKKRKEICSRLILLCDRLIILIRSKNLVLTDYLDRYDDPLLPFLSSDFLKERVLPETLLSRQDNKALSEILYSLGREDSEAQQRLLEGYQSRLIIREREYTAIYDKNARLYPAFGVFTGLLIALTLL